MDEPDGFDNQGDKVGTEEGSRPGGGVIHGFKRTFKGKIIAGLIVTFPLVITFYVIELLFNIIDGIFGHTLERLFGRPVPGLGLVIALLVVFVVGVFATTVIGRRLIDWMERLMLSLPVVNSIYSTIKQLGDAFSPHNKAAFKKFVIVDYPMHGVHAFGFLTKECTIKDDRGREECYMTVYIPTNHLYLGDIALFKKDEVIVTDLGIEEGIKIVLSAGIAAPDTITRSRRTTEQLLQHDKAPGEGHSAD